MDIIPAHLEAITEEHRVILKELVAGHKRIICAAGRAWGHIVKNFGGAAWLWITDVVSMRGRKVKEIRQRTR